MREFYDDLCVEIDNPLTEGGQLRLEHSPPRSWSQPLEPVGSLFSLRMRCSQSDRHFWVKFRKVRAQDRPYFVEDVSRLEEWKEDHAVSSPTHSVTANSLDWSNFRSCPYCCSAPSTKSFLRQPNEWRTLEKSQLVSSR